MKILLEHGVDTVFGYPGGTALFLYDELYKYSDQIRHVLTAHEQGAAHAADGYARSFNRNIDLAAGDTDIGMAADAVRIAFSDCGDFAAGDADAASSSFIAANGDSRIIPDSFYGAAGDFYPC